MLVAARSICHISQPPKMSPDGLVSAGMVVVRITGGKDGGAWGAASSTFGGVCSVMGGLSFVAFDRRPWGTQPRG